MLTAGSHANERREPGQAGNGAAISVSPLCCGATQLELAVAANPSKLTRRKVHGHFNKIFGKEVAKIVIEMLR